MLAELVGRLGAYFAPVEPLRQAGKYVRGLISALPRKTGGPGRVHRGPHPGSAATARLMGHLRGERAVRDFLKKTGTRTAGVKRQYVGCAGKVANAVNATYTRHVATPIGGHSSARSSR
jgi:hypothetical protein